MDWSAIVGAAITGISAIIVAVLSRRTNQTAKRTHDKVEAMERTTVSDSRIRRAVREYATSHPGTFKEAVVEELARDVISRLVDDNDT